MKNIIKKILSALKKFFYPAPGSPRWMFVLPIVTLVFIGVLTLSIGVYGWEYSNSPKFCGTTCHTMPPQDAVYKISPHANVTCEECHIGRASLPDQFIRKQQGLKELYYMVFNLYEYPIRASALQPARDTCEKCHQPEAFSGDSLRTITHFDNDYENTRTTIYLILKTGGGSKREGLGRGIHWHIVNKVSYYATDELAQEIPFVRVYNDDGTTTDYVDVEADFDPASIDESQLQEIDCVTCHNRITHEFKYPDESVDESMARGLISPEIPGIHQLAVELLTTPYANHDQAMNAIAGLDDYYKSTDYYAGNAETIQQAITEIQAIYNRTVFQEQEIDWTTHPNNLGHINSPGCFRCHDGTHLNDQQEAVRLECNVCHSIPVVAGKQDFVTTIEINSGGIEPESHLNPNWISLHNQVFLVDTTCSNCHTTENPGGVTNTSFCSNSACHGNVFTFAGFDAPKLREALASQLPTPEPEPTPAPVVGDPTYDANIGPMLDKCAACHGDGGSAGLNVTTYADLMKGANDGPVIIPGDSAGSKLVQVQSGSHFFVLSEEQLALVKQWIDAGAPEK